MIDDRSVIVHETYAGLSHTKNIFVVDPHELQGMQGTYVVGRVEVRSQLSIIANGGDVRISERTKTVLDAIKRAKAEARGMMLVPVQRLAMTRTTRDQKNLSDAPDRKDFIGDDAAYAKKLAQSGPFKAAEAVFATDSDMQSLDQILPTMVDGKIVAGTTPCFLVYKTRRMVNEPLALMDLMDLYSMLLEHLYARNPTGQKTRSLLSRILEQVTPKAEMSMVNMTSAEANRAPAMDAIQALSGLMWAEAFFEPLTWLATRDPRYQAIVAAPSNYSSSAALTTGAGITTLEARISTRMASIMPPVNLFRALYRGASVDALGTAVILGQRFKESLKLANQLLFSGKEPLMINWNGPREDFLIAVDLLKALEMVLDELPLLNDYEWTYRAESVEIKEQGNNAKYIAQLAYQSVFYDRMDVILPVRHMGGPINLKAHPSPTLVAANKMVSAYGPVYVTSGITPSSWITSASLEHGATRIIEVRYDADEKRYQAFVELMNTRTARGLTVMIGPIAGYIPYAAYLPLMLDNILGAPMFDEVRPYNHVKITEEPKSLELLGTQVMPRRPIPAGGVPDLIDLPAASNIVYEISKPTIQMPADWRLE